eukprot:TRINITY_DN219_c0_g1_i1.p1 TRINITY_DN219_c0_g1~~TRINITY_DN219_c0_g1_i1.p1  ORF type:complete len:182 (-),score=55.87 TRINITY_DN219_c0_g1_i1:253-798(-)
MRNLKYHEKKLLKKVDLFSWKKERNIHENAILSRYKILRREDYYAYDKLSGRIKKIANRLKKLDFKDPFRIKMTDELLGKLYRMGLINVKKNLKQCAEIPASAFCRRRLPVVLVRMKFCENLKQATEFVQGGHIRIGPNIITDPSFHVTRIMEDFVTWSDHSKIKKHILKYNDKLDDYDLL